MLPLQRFQILDTRSIQVARHDMHLFRRVDRYEALGDPGTFHIQVNSLLLDGVRLSAVRTSGHWMRPIDGEHATLLVAEHGLLLTDDGRATHAVRDGEAVLPRPGIRTTTIPGAYVGFVLQVPMALLAARAAENGEDPWDPAGSWPSHPKPRLTRALRFVIADLDEDARTPPSSRALRGMSRLLSDLLVDEVADGAAAKAQAPSLAGLAVVRRAEEALRGRLHDVVSIVALAGELGVGIHRRRRYTAEG